MIKKLNPYVVSVLIALSVGGLSALITKNNMSVYLENISPPLTPPSWVFPVVWTILFILMGISAAMIYTNKTTPYSKKRSALLTYSLSLLVNFFWSIIFFNLRAFFFAFIWLLLLLFLIISTIIKYQKIDKLAAYLQIPYALWVTFAGYLTLAIWLLNR